MTAVFALLLPLFSQLRSLLSRHSLTLLALLPLPALPAKASCVAKKLAIGLALLLGTSIISSPVWAQCIAVSAQQALPIYIRANQCFELQGGNVLSGQFTVHGKLFVKSGRQVTLAPNSVLSVSNDGLLSVRGELDLQSNSQLNFQNGNFECSGMTTLAPQAKIMSLGQNKVRNIGRILMDPQSAIILAGATAIRNSGQLVLENASFELYHSSTLDNAGTFIVRNNSRLALGDQSSMENTGNLSIDRSSKLNLNEQSRLNNKRICNFEGELGLGRNTILENNAP